MERISPQTHHQMKTETPIDAINKAHHTATAIYVQGSLTILVHESTTRARVEESYTTWRVKDTVCGAS